MSYYLLKVCILNRPALNRLFDYFSKEEVASGKIVEVEFNKALVKGLVIESKLSKEIKGIKEINKINNDFLDAEVLVLLKLLEKKYFVFFNQALKSLYPKTQLPLNINNINQNNDRFQTFYLKENLEDYIEKNMRLFKEYKSILIVCPDVKSVKKAKLVIRYDNILIIHKNDIGLIYPNVDLIIVNDATNYRYRISKYNQFDTFDLARFKAKYKNIPLILADMEFNISFYKSFIDKEIKLFNDFEIINDKPIIKLIEMNLEIQKGNFSLISEPLKKIITDNIIKKERTLLIHPFKGYSHLISCRSCQNIIKCPVCLKVLAYHKEKNIVTCSCGYKKNGLSNCSQCNNETFIEGYPGLEQFSEELKTIFKDAKMLIAEYNKNINNTDIVLTTDINLSELDFNVIGFLSFDFYNNLKDYNAKERCFLDIRTIINNLNRKSKETNLVIQSFEFNNDALEFAINNDFEGFYEEEIINRERAHTSPFRNTLKLEITGRKAATKALDIFFELQKDKLLRVLRPIASKEKKNCQEIKINYPPDYFFDRTIKALLEKYKDVTYLIERLS